MMRDVNWGCVKKLGYRLLIVRRRLVFCKVDDEKRQVIIYAVMEAQRRSPRPAVYIQPQFAAGAVQECSSQSISCSVLMSPERLKRPSRYRLSGSGEMRLTCSSLVMVAR